MRYEIRIRLAIDQNQKKNVEQNGAKPLHFPDRAGDLSKPQPRHPRPERRGNREREAVVLLPARVGHSSPLRDGPGMPENGERGTVRLNERKRTRRSEPMPVPRCAQPVTARAR